MIEEKHAKFIHNIAKQNLKKDKMRNILIIIVIAFATAFVNLFVLFYNSDHVATEKFIDTMQHVYYHELSIEELTRIEQNEEISESRRIKKGISSEHDGYMITPYFYEHNNSSITSTIPPFEGSYPLKANEILVDKFFYEYYGADVAIGDTVTLEFYDGNTEEFVITGMNNVETSYENQYIYMSEEYATNGSQLKDFKYTLAAKIHDAKSMNKYSFMETIDEIGLEIELPKQYINPNNSFISSLSMTTQEISIIIFLSLFIFIVSAVVIYSIFYISVMNRIRELGQLRTIGATKKQIKKIISHEGIILASYGVPVGVIISVIISIFLKPSGFELISVLLISLVVTCAMFITVLLSVKKPAKLAGNVSPMEALKQTVETSKKKQTRELERGLSPINLAMMHRKVNYKKFIMTSLSLGLTGAVFMMGTTYLASYDMDASARIREYKFTDVKLSLSPNAIETHENGKNGLQLEKPFSDELLTSISNIDGVNEIIKLGDFYTDYEFSTVRASTDITTFTDEDLAKIKTATNGLDVDYDDFVENNGIIVNAYNAFPEIFGVSLELGDEVVLRWFDGEKEREEKFTVMGLVARSSLLSMYADKDTYHYPSSSGGWFAVADETYDNMMIESFDKTNKLLISTEDWAKDGDVIVSQLEEILLDHPDVIIEETLTDRYEVAQLVYDGGKNTVIVAILFLGLFSIINLFNTLITNVLSRKHEFAVMQSIGLTDAQLKKVIRSEGLLFASYNVIITLVFGSILGFLMTLGVQALGMFYIIWKFPTIYFLAYIAVIVIIPLLISICAIKLLKKQSIVERLRDN